MASNLVKVNYSRLSLSHSSSLHKYGTGEKGYKHKSVNLTIPDVSVYTCFSSLDTEQLHVSDMTCVVSWFWDQLRLMWSWHSDCVSSLLLLNVYWSINVSHMLCLYTLTQIKMRHRWTVFLLFYWTSLQCVTGFPYRNNTKITLLEWTFLTIPEFLNTPCTTIPPL